MSVPRTPVPRRGGRRSWRIWPLIDPIAGRAHCRYVDEGVRREPLLGARSSSSWRSADRATMNEPPTSEGPTIEPEEKTMIKLFGHPASTCTRKVLTALAETQTPYEFCLVDLTKGEHKQ